MLIRARPSRSSASSSTHNSTHHSRHNNRGDTTNTSYKIPQQFSSSHHHRNSERHKYDRIPESHPFNSSTPQPKPLHPILCRESVAVYRNLLRDLKLFPSPAMQKHYHGLIRTGYEMNQYDKDPERVSALIRRAYVDARYIITRYLPSAQRTNSRAMVTEPNFEGLNPKDFLQESKTEEELDLEAHIQNLNEPDLTGVPESYSIEQDEDDDDDDGPELLHPHQAAMKQEHHRERSGRPDDHERAQPAPALPKQQQLPWIASPLSDKPKRKVVVKKQQTAPEKSKEKAKKQS